jgi:hypothetical protein
MCPACLAAAALITGSAFSTGALPAIIGKKFWTKNFVNGNVAQNKGESKWPVAKQPHNVRRSYRKPSGLQLARNF